MNNFKTITKLGILTLIVTLILGISGCETDSGDNFISPVNEEGKITLHLSKKFEDDNISLENLKTQSTTLSRTVNEVQSLLQGYRVKIKGNNMNKIKDAYFENGETETSVSFSIPEGEGYTVQVIALGIDINSINSNKLLLGAGEATGVVVEANSDNIIEVPMEPYKFDFSNNPQTATANSAVEVTATISGPLLSEVLDISVAHLYYYRNNDLNKDFGYYQGERVFDVLYNFIDNTHIKYIAEIPALSSGPLYFQFTTSGLSSWDYNETSFSLVVPCLSAGESDKLPLIQLEEEVINSGIDVIPKW